MVVSFTNWEMGFDLNYLQHHGIKGQKWGQRRYQNEDGSLTDAGKARIAKHNRFYLQPLGDGRRKNSEREKVRNKALGKELYLNLSRKRFENFKDKYADAVLKDAKLASTPKSRQQVKDLLKKMDPGYSYSFYRSEVFGDGPHTKKDMRDAYMKGSRNQKEIINYKKTRKLNELKKERSIYEDSIKTNSRRVSSSFAKKSSYPFTTQSYERDPFRKALYSDLKNSKRISKKIRKLDRKIDRTNNKMV